MNGVLANSLLNQLKDLTVIQFVEHVCSDISIKEDELADEFVKRLVELLFKVSESAVEFLKNKLHKIIGVLVEVGVVCRSKLNADKNLKMIEKHVSAKLRKKRKLEDVPLNFLKDIEYLDSRLEKVLLLYQMDNRINLLTKEKMKVYQDIFKSGVKDILLVPEETISNQTNSFQHETVNRVLEHETRYLTIKPELYTDNYDNQPDQDVARNCMDEPSVQENEEIDDRLSGSWKGSTSSLESSSKSLISKCVKSPVTCLKFYLKTCYAGCLNGDVVFINVKHWKVENIRHIHNATITSIFLWSNRMITSSLDKTLKCYDMNLCKTKSMCLNSSIESITDDERGVIYVGTATGHVHRFNILSFTEIGSSIQVSSEQIFCLKIFEVNCQLLLIVSAKGRPLTIRDAVTCSLIRSIIINDMKLFDIIHGVPNILIGTAENKIYSIQLDNKSVVKTRPFPNGCLTLLSQGNAIYILNNEGKVFIYNNDFVCTRVDSINTEIGDDEISAFSVYKHDYIIFLKNQMLFKRFKMNVDQVAD